MSLLHLNDRPGAYPPSWYAASAEIGPPRPPARGALRADVAIVGGGYTGLSAALHLAEAGAEVVVLEAHRAGFGASGRNGGQVGTGQRRDQIELERLVGPEHARRLWELSLDAVALVRALIDRLSIAADWRPGVAEACWQPRSVRHAHALAEHLAARYGYTAMRPLDRGGIAALTGSEVFAGGLLDAGSGHLHPLRYALGLAAGAEAAGARLHEGSEVTALERAGTGWELRTGSATLRAGQVILAGNGYLAGLAPALARRVLPINNFIVATEPLGARAPHVLPGGEAVADDRFVVDYWRLSPDRRLIFGGGESYGDRFPADIAALVRPRLAAIYPGLAEVPITHAWGGTLAITASRLPHIARPGPGLFAAGGYSGHGVALATLCGKLMAEAARGPSAGFDAMAALPVPRFPGGPALRKPLMALAMRWYALRDRLGI